MTWQWQIKHSRHNPPENNSIYRNTLNYRWNNTTRTVKISGEDVVLTICHKKLGHINIEPKHFFAVTQLFLCWFFAPSALPKRGRKTNTKQSDRNFWISFRALKWLDKLYVNIKSDIGVVDELLAYFCNHVVNYWIELIKLTVVFFCWYLCFSSRQCWS